MTVIGGFAIVVTFVAALALPSGRTRLPVGLKVVDIPNARSSHQTPVFRLGGLATLVAFVCGGVLALAGGFFVTAVCVAAGACVSVLGLLDDVRGVRVPARLASQFVVGFAAVATLRLLLGAPWWVIPAGAVGFAAYVNVANFMDGINAISALHALVVGVSFAALGWVSGQSWLVLAGSLIAVAFAAFLPWNLVGSRMFLGDVGSYLLGGSVAAVAVAAVLSGVFWVGVVGPLTIYILETSWAVVQRVASRQPWWQAHRMHLYQRLVDHGFGQIAVAVLVTGSSALAAVAGTFSLVREPWGWAVASVGIVVSAVAYFGVSAALLRAPVRSLV